MNVQKASLRPVYRRKFMQISAASLALAATGCRRRGHHAASTVTVASAPGPLKPSNDNEENHLVFLSLLTVNAKGELEPGLAQSWEHSADYRDWTFHLRPGVRWHDGVPVTSADVKFTLDLKMHPDVLMEAPGASSFYSLRSLGAFAHRATRCRVNMQRSV